MNTHPARISVVIPAYNRENYLGEAIQSVLGQTLPPDEIIVVDDGSTDHTADVARSFGGIVRCLTRVNGGVGPARNDGVAASTGGILTFLDSDDLWTPYKLERQTAYLDRHPETDLVFGHMEAFISPELHATYTQSVDTGAMPGMCASTLMLRKEVFEKIGPFDPAERVTEFIEWFSRAQEMGCSSFVLPELVVKRRVHLTNCVHDRKKMNRQYARVLKTILDRRRTAAPSS